MSRPTHLSRRLRAIGITALALGAIASHRDLGGQPLPLRIASVELLNVLRPTVAVAVFITFAAHALHLHPEWRARFRAGDDEPRIRRGIQLTMNGLATALRNSG